MKTYRVELAVSLDETKEQSRAYYNELAAVGMDPDQDTMDYNIETLQEKLNCKIVDLGDNWYEITIDDIDRFLDCGAYHQCTEA